MLVPHWGGGGGKSYRAKGYGKVIGQNVKGHVHFSNVLSEVSNSQNASILLKMVSNCWDIFISIYSFQEVKVQL